MADKNRGNSLSHLRTVFNVGAIGALSDGQLLDRFTTGRGELRELAFAALVERHGDFVLRVCRSVLRDENAADDAFQATFLALARKAESLGEQHSLAPWLHQAAFRAALHDRSATFRRRQHEQAVAARWSDSVASSDRGNDDDLEKIIHEEIDRLPGRFRVAVVLCDLEGRTHEQAARHLGCAVGTVKSRLSRGRRRLRGRLERRGVAPAPAIMAAFAGGAARGVVPTGLAAAAVEYAAKASGVPKTVAVLTDGVLKSMLLSKIKLAMTLALLVAALAAGAIAVAQSEIGRTKQKAGESKQAGSENAAKASEGDSSRLDGDQEQARIVLTKLKAVDVNITQRYLSTIRAHHHIEVRTLVSGHISEISVKEGQAVKKGDQLFKILPVRKAAKVQAEEGEAKLAGPERKKKTEAVKKGSSDAAPDEEVLFQAKLAKAKAKLERAKADLELTLVKAPFDGLIGRIFEQVDSFVNEGDALTTLSDNGVMWVYFNVPERQYLEYMANQKQHLADKIELELANDEKFPQPGKIGAIAGDFNRETGNIAFRADFPNPNGVLRHGQTGTILVRRKLPDAIVVPMRATYENNDKQYVYVVDKDDVAHRREIFVEHETDDLFVIKKGVRAGDRIVVEGIRKVRNGEKVRFELRTLEEVMAKEEDHRE